MRAQLLVPYTRESLVFGGLHRFIHIEAGRLRANDSFARSVRTLLPATSDEVRGCVKKAEFVANWFALTGAPSTVMALLGVRP